MKILVNGFREKKGLKDKDMSVETCLKSVHFFDAAYINGYLWTNALEWNGYYRINVVTGKTEFLGLFAHADILADKLFSRVLAYEKYVFFVPWFSDYLVRLNIETLNTKYWKLPENIVTKKAKFREANIYNGKIFMFPAYGDIISIFNIKEENFTFDERLKDDLNGRNGDFLQGCQIENNIYLPSYLNRTLVKYNMDNSDYDVTQFPLSEKAILDIVQYSDKEFLVLSAQGNIWKVNFDNGNKEIIYRYDGNYENPYIHIIYHSNNLYLIPDQETDIRIVKGKISEDIPYPAGWKIKYVETGIEELFSGYYLHGNQIWLFPMHGNMLLKLDTDHNLIDGVKILDDSARHTKMIIDFMVKAGTAKEIYTENKMTKNAFIEICKNNIKSENDFVEENGRRIWKALYQ